MEPEQETKGLKKEGMRKLPSVSSTFLSVRRSWEVRLFPTNFLLMQKLILWLELEPSPISHKPHIIFRILCFNFFQNNVPTEQGQWRTMDSPQTQTGGRIFFCKCYDIILVINMKLLINATTSAVFHADHRESFYTPKVGCSSSIFSKVKPLFSWKGVVMGLLSW